MCFSIALSEAFVQLTWPKQSTVVINLRLHPSFGSQQMTLSQPAVETNLLFSKHQMHEHFLIMLKLYQGSDRGSHTVQQVLLYLDEVIKVSAYHWCLISSSKKKKDICYRIIYCRPQMSWCSGETHPRPHNLLHLFNYKFWEGPFYQFFRGAVMGLSVTKVRLNRPSKQG